MDIGAYAKINDLSTILDSTGINIPRLRGLRLMAMEEIKRVEEELERNPYYTDSNVKIVNMTAEELYNDIMQNGGSYDIIGGLPTLKKIIEKKKNKKTVKKE